MPAGRPSKLDDAAWDLLVKFYHEGHTQAECAARFGVSRRTVQRYFDKHPEIPRRKPLEPSRVEKAARARDPKVLERYLEEEAARNEKPGRPLPSRKRRKIIKLEDYEL